MDGELIRDELPLDHEPSLDHWAKALADDDIATGYHTNWDHAYESAWNFIEDETLCHVEYRKYPTHSIYGEGYAYVT